LIRRCTSENGNFDPTYNVPECLPACPLATCLPAYVPTCLCTCLRAYVPACLRAYACLRPNACIGAFICAFIRSQIRAFLRSKRSMNINSNIYDKRNSRLAALWIRINTHKMRNVGGNNIQIKFSRPTTSRRPVDRPLTGLETLCAASSPSHARLEAILGLKQAVTT
jgi:hypothetical protein